MNIKWIFLLLGCLNIHCFGQALDKPGIKELSIGSTMPPVVIKNVLNYDAGALDFWRLKGKLVILDFWATWCHPCVAALPKMQALQEKYGDKIKIITVTMEKKETVEQFLNTHAIGQQQVSLPVVYGDTLLSSYFKYTAVPHEVWINKQGIVTAITSAQYVREANIDMVLNGVPINWYVKRETKGFDYKMPLFAVQERTGDIAAPMPLFYSGFMGNIPGIGSAQYKQKDTITGTSRYNQYNQPILNLYSIAFNNRQTFVNPKRCELHVSDRDQYVYDADKSMEDDWNAQNCYSYEAFLPITMGPVETGAKLKDDLDQFLGLKTQVVDRNVQCWVLKTKDKNQPLPVAAKGQLPQRKIGFSGEGAFSYIQKAGWVSDFVRSINNNSRLYSLPLLIDETGARAALSFTLDVGKNYTDPQAWKRELNKFNLDISVETREMDILVINEQKIVVAK